MEGRVNIEFKELKQRMGVINEILCVGGRGWKIKLLNNMTETLAVLTDMNLDEAKQKALSIIASKSRGYDKEYNYVKDLINMISARQLTN